MQVRDIMSQTVVSVEKDESLDRVLDRMRKENVTKIPVLNDGDLVGFISDAEVATELGALKNKGIPAHQLYATSVMERELRTADPDDRVDDIIRICRNSGVPIVMVPDGNGGIQGVVTKSDLLPLVKSDRPLRAFAERDVLTVAPDDRVIHARRLMVDHGIERLPVLAEGGLVGVVAEADIAYGLAKFKKHVPVNHQKAQLQTFYVDQVMTPDPVTAEPDETAADAAERMHDTGVGCLPILDDDGSLFGIVTRTDLILEI